MAPIGSAFGAEGAGAFGQPVEGVELPRFDPSQCQMAVCEALDTAGRIELRPFRAQHGNGVAFVAQLTAHLGNAFGLKRRVKFDLVDV